jgi:hypothetical protein
MLAQGGEAEGLAVVDAVHAGGAFAAYKRAFAPFERKHVPLPLVGVHG